MNPGADTTKLGSAIAKRVEQAEAGESKDYVDITASNAKSTWSQLSTQSNGQ